MVSFRLDNEVFLREFEADDAEIVYETVIANFEHLQRFMHWIVPDYNVDSARQFIAQTLASRVEKRSLGFGIFREERFIGSIGFTTFDWAAKKTEIGYWLAADEQGKGIITESCRRLIDLAISEMGMNRIEIRCSSKNLRSSAIPKKLGFRQEGYLRQAEFRNGELHDFEIYGVLAAEWRSDNAGTS